MRVTDEQIAEWRTRWSPRSPLHERVHQVLDALEQERKRADHWMDKYCRRASWLRIDAETRLTKATSALRATLKSRAQWIHDKCLQVDQLLREKWALEARIAKVRELHVPTPHTGIGQFCTGCSDPNGDVAEWPCPTIQALEGE